MKYTCLGYLEPGIFERMAEDERNAVLDACFTYDDHLRANGQAELQVACCSSWQPLLLLLQF